MKPTHKYIILFLTILFCYTASYAQNYKRTLLYSIQTETIYGVPYKTELTDLGDFELAGLLTPVTKENFEIDISDNNELTIINKHLTRPLYDGDYENEVAMSVTDENGTILYDHNGDIIPINGDIDPPAILTIEDHQVAEYGIFNNLFSPSFADICNIFLQSGFQIQYNYNQNLIKARKNDFEIMMDYGNLTIEERHFQNNILIKASTHIYQDINGFIIPLTKINTSYDTINNIRVQELKIRTYFNYSIFEYGNKIVAWEAKEALPEKQGFKINEYQDYENHLHFKIYPNPASHFCNIEVNNLNGKKYSIEMFNMSGKKVLEKGGIVNNTAQIDISHLKSGNYVITCTIGEEKESLIVVIN